MAGIEQPAFLPTSRRELERLGWHEIDVLLVSGDAYVDHPSFGTALLGRWLVSRGFRVGVVAQPRWDDTVDLEALGRPRLFAGVSAGAVDSMLAHYTAFRKKRRDDAYAAGGKSGNRPNRATLVYTGLVRRAFPGLPVVIGGIEASLRRVSHYDFWSDRLRRSALLDSKADLLVYGMAEGALDEVARRIDAGRPLRGIEGTAWADERSTIPADAEVVELPSHETLEAEPRLLVEATLALERQVHQGRSWVTQRSAKRTVVVAPPSPPLSSAELDALYALPLARASHPSYREPVPAEEMIRFSVGSHRGCGGGCAFCSLALHQGRQIRSRSADSIEGEVARLAKDPRWRGSLSDVGGPSANMWSARCEHEAGPTACERPSCLHPKPCKHFSAGQAAQIALLRRLKALPEVKHVRVASGVRHDLALLDPGYIDALAEGFVGGQLKVAPEHVSDRVLGLMRKPRIGPFERFCDRFDQASRRAGKQQYLVPYLLSAHPGCTDDDMRELGRWLARRRWRPQQVQCFIPTPGTIATAMFHAGCDAGGRKIHVARTDAERLRQHRLLVGDAPKPQR